MRLYTFQNPYGEVRVGYEHGDGCIVELEGIVSMKQLIEKNAMPAALLNEIDSREARRYGVSEVKLLPPITDPQKLIFVGLNYHDHALESGMPVPEKPLFFCKFNNSLAGDRDEIEIPSETSECDYEVELAVIIGRRAKNVSLEDAMDYVYGYTVCNDLSARDLQLKEGSQWTRGKAIDGFAPMGPCIVTSDEIQDPHALSLVCKVNGKIVQNGHTSQLIFGIPQLISHLSKTMTLEQGDVISTGTPAGVGLGQKPPLWLKPGDLVEVSIEGLGGLANRMI